IDEPTVVVAMAAGLSREGAGMPANVAEVNAAPALRRGVAAKAASMAVMPPARLAAAAPIGSIGAPPRIFRARRRATTGWSDMVIYVGNGLGSMESMGATRSIDDADGTPRGGS